MYSRSDEFVIREEKREIKQGLALGKNHSCKILSDKNVVCWGNNEYGQLGNGSNENSAKPL